MAEMKAGYKKTDIGVTPEDWDIKSYGEVFDFLSTISNSRADLCFKGDFGYIHYGDIHTRWENTLDLSKDELPELRRDKIKKLPASLRNGDLVMADASEDYEGIAKTVEVKNIGEKKIFSGLHTFLMRDRNAVFSDGIRGYIHEMPVVRQQIQKVATGLKVFGVSKNTLKNVQIPVPKPEEQKQIAAALSDVDGLIESLEQLITKKRDMKTAAMQQLLTGKKRLPGFGGEWAEYQIKEFTHCIAGGTPSTLVDEYWNGQIRWMSSGELNNKVIYDVSGRITELGLKNSSASMVPEKCVLIGLAGQGKTRGTAAINFVALSTNQSIAAIFPSYKHCSLYLYYSLDNRYHELRELSSGGGGRGGLNLSIINKISIPFPSLEEQQAISQILFDMDIEIYALEQRLAKARSLKTGMMQELLTGKTRLIKTDKKQEAA